MALGHQSDWHAGQTGCHQRPLQPHQAAPADTGGRKEVAFIVALCLCVQQVQRVVCVSRLQADLDQCATALCKGKLRGHDRPVEIATQTDDTIANGFAGATQRHARQTGVGGHCLGQPQLESGCSQRCATLRMKLSQ